MTTPVTYRLNQVRFDSLYLPLPKNVGTPLVWSLVLEGAPDGGPEASTFAVPISIEQPNVGGLPAGASGTFLGPRQGGDAYAATSSGETGGDGSWCAPSRARA